MQRMWAPWRLKYVQKKTKSCIFCRAAKSKKDRKNYLVYRGKFAFAILNIFPYTNGHLMIAPYRHVKDLRQLNSQELLDLLEVLKIIKNKLDKLLKPAGYNIGINVGKAAGAGIENHLHIHIVPRWLGDINFMPIISETKVISQSLNDLYNNLRKTFKK